jgi:hypothetical protein
MRFFAQHNKRGIGLVEMVIGAAIITTGALSLIAAFNIYMNYAFSNTGNVQAAYLAEEGLEVMTYFRDKSWLNISRLSTTTPYYIYFTGGDWATSTTQQLVGSFYRRIRLEDVQRDSNGLVVTSGGTFDTDSKKVTVTIEYPTTRGTSTRSIITYITNIHI